MHLSRLALSGTGLLVLFSIFCLGTSCGDEQSKAKFVRFTCSPNITVTLDPTASIPVNPTDIYVCTGGTVTWKPAPTQPNLKFNVFFKHHMCPFVPDCKGIDQDHPTSKPMKNHSTLTVYDYGVLMNDDVFDPHVVGGGG